jgi:hypothetical protein
VNRGLYEDINTRVTGLRSQSRDGGFVADAEGAATVGQAQGPLEGTNFSLPSPSSAILRSHGFVESFVYAREIRLSSQVVSQGLLAKVEGTAELTPSVLDRHGAMLQPCRPEQYHSPVARLKEHSVGGKRELASGSGFSCPGPTTRMEFCNCFSQLIKLGA